MYPDAAHSVSKVGKSYKEMNSGISKLFSFVNVYFKFLGSSCELSNAAQSNPEVSLHT